MAEMDDHLLGARVEKRASVGFRGINMKSIICILLCDSHSRAWTGLDKAFANKSK